MLNDFGVLLTLGLPNCPAEDLTCQKDQAGYDAVKQLHSQIDDNQDGGLNWAESDEVLLIID